MATKELREGTAIGGPIDGARLMSRAAHGPKGVLLVDKERERAAVYEWDGEDGTYVHVRSDEDNEEGWRELDHDKRLRAGLGLDWEVIAYDHGSQR